MARRGTRSLARRAAHRSPKRRFILYCEGTNTEPVYFRAVQREFAKVILSIEPGIGVPYTVATAAAKRCHELGLSSPNARAKLDSYEQEDEVWAIFDRDQHPKFDEAVVLCRKAGVLVARSNPCFEIWIVLHIEDFQKPDGRHAVQAKLRTLLPEYNPSKGKTAKFADLLAGIEIAEQRAEAQLRRRAAEGAPYGPPSTTVFALTRAIRSAQAR